MYKEEIFDSRAARDTRYNELKLAHKDVLRLTVDVKDETGRWQLKYSVMHRGVSADDKSIKILDSTYVAQNIEPTVDVEGQ